MDFSVWLAFFAASWAISLSPGAGAVAAMSAGLSHGFRRGYFMTFGLILGILTQVVLVSAGATAGTNCTWDITGITLSQTIPAEQNQGTYSIGLTITSLAL